MNEKPVNKYETALGKALLSCLDEQHECNIKCNITNGTGTCFKEIRITGRTVTRKINSGEIIKCKIRDTIITHESKYKDYKETSNIYWNSDNPYSPTYF